MKQETQDYHANLNIHRKDSTVNTAEVSLNTKGIKTFLSLFTTMDNQAETMN